MLLARVRRLPRDRLVRLSRRRAKRAAAAAAKRSPAYQTILRSHGIAPELVSSGVAFTDLPILDKDNTFARFALGELAGSVQAGDLADILTSSGRGGRTFGYRMSTRRSHDRSWFDVDLGLQDAFDVDRKPTLLVNCLPMGVVFSSRAVAVANVSVREDMACAILREVGPSFAQTVVCCDPLFIKRLLDHAATVGVDWNRLHTSVVIGEEVLVESHRDYIAARMGIDPDRDTQRMVASSFGVGELGLNLLFETRDTIAIRRALRRGGKAIDVIGPDGSPVGPPAVFCYNPLRTFLEVIEPDASGYGELCITMLDRHAVIPLPRYRTGDIARLPSEAETAALSALVGRAPWLPIVLLKGRAGDRPAHLPDVESVKEVIYRHPVLADCLTGAFRIRPGDAGLAEVTLQLMPGADMAVAQQALAGVEADACAALKTRCNFNLVPGTVAGWGPPVDYERKFPYFASPAS